MGDIKIFELQNFKYEHDLSTFVETGTFRGEGVEFALDYFEDVHSIEIDKVFADGVIKMFANEPRASIYNGASVDILSNILPRIDTNILFWLDAHFPGADSRKVAYDNEPNMDLRAPLSLELETIFNLRPAHKDVIIVDDLWLYEDGPFEWGSFNEHSQKCGMNLTREELIKNKNLNSFYKLYEPEFDINKRYEHQGYLIITPKQD